MWKTIAKWLRDRIDLNVDLDVQGGQVAVAVTVKLGDLTVLSERFTWTVPKPGSPVRLAGSIARRERLA